MDPTIECQMTGAIGWCVRMLVIFCRILLRQALSLSGMLMRLSRKSPINCRRMPIGRPFMRIW